ncbi:acyltransferase [Rhabdaerophilum sp. SD176]|uniref:acyltransferase family protein n=1 Tax=Rhabdaerophilum sp. SD176 TaxID=2983548 RepID=UPI0024DFF787|nr:acyltransferase [Rhabdaerophilum sp. SD176]
MQGSLSHRFVALDAWRGIAALLVALYRLEADGWLHGLPFVQNAWLFVDFFFVLSGFVIAYAYLGKLGKPRETLVFIVRRIGRVWPLHVVLLGIFLAFEIARGLAGFIRSAPVSVFIDQRAPITVLWDLLLVQALGFTGVTLWNTPAWSISTEFWTYIVFALLCFGGRRLLAVAAATLILGGLAVVGAFSPKGMDTTFDFGFARCLAGFFSGVLASFAWQGWLRAKTLTAKFATSLEIGAIAAAILFVSLVGRTQASLAAPFVFAGLVLVFAFQSGWISAVLSGKVGHVLGDLSYSIYMTALLVSLPFNRVPVLAANRAGVEITREHVGAGNPHINYDFGHFLLNDLYSLIYLLAVVAVSWITFRFIEKPSRTWFNGKVG